MIRRLTGRPPRGWLGPGLRETWETPDLLAEAGIEYVCGWVNDDQPYEIRTATRPRVMVPHSVAVNDIPMMPIRNREAPEFYDRARYPFDRLYDEGRGGAMAIPVHPYISGVPHRVKHFEKIYAHMGKRPGVLFWKGEDVLDWHRATAGRQGATRHEGS